jgi:hypothetical protein
MILYLYYLTKREKKMKKILGSLLVAGLLVAGCTKSDSSNSVSHSVVQNVVLSNEDGLALYEKLYEDFLALENVTGFTLKDIFNLNTDMSMEVPGYGSIVASIESSNERNDLLNYNTQRYYRNEETVTRVSIPAFPIETEPEVTLAKWLEFFDETTNEKVYTFITTDDSNVYERIPSSKSAYAEYFAEEYNVEAYVEDILLSPDDIIDEIEVEVEGNFSVEFLTDVNRTTLKLTILREDFSGEYTQNGDFSVLIGPDFFNLNILISGYYNGSESLELKVANPDIDIHILDSYL